MRLISVLLISVLLSSCAETIGQKKLSPVEFKSELEKTEQAQLIDVRTPGEYQSGHLKDASNYNVNDEGFEEKLNGLDKDKPLFLYCGSGKRSGNAANIAVQLGFKEVFDLKGGIGAWSNDNLPVE